MPSSSKPRKKYRKRWVSPDPVALAIGGVKTLHSDKSALLAKQVLNSGSLAALCQGKATKQDMDTLIHMHNAVEALWMQGYGKEFSEVLIRGKAAILDVCQRGVELGRFVIKAAERQALNDLLELYDAQMEVASLRDVAMADARAIHEIATGKAIVIKDKEKLRLALQHEAKT